MAESTLSGGYSEFRTETAHYLGLTRTESSWSADEVLTLNSIIKRALRQFYWPPVVNNERPHEWSFLKPVTELVTVAPYATGTIAIANGATTVTLTGGIWPDWTATHGSLVINTVEYVIASRTDDTNLELAVAWAETTETASDYLLQHDGNYDMPDDFGGLNGPMVVESDNYKPNITMVGEGQIRTLRQQAPYAVNSGSTTTPFYVAIRPKEHTVTTTGQRFEILFYPLPNDAYTFSYVKRILPEMLIDTSLEYPYGGAEHAETILTACLSVAEEQENGNQLGGNKVYDKKKLFQERLAASIQLDKLKNNVDYFGYNGDNSDRRHRPYRSDGSYDRRNGWCNNDNVTYNGNID
jgi:hypothetical protein